MKELLLKDKDLYNYITKSQMVDDLEAKIQALKDIIEDCNEKFEKLDEAGEFTLAEYYCQKSNECNQKRILLALEKNRLEQELLVFELVSCLEN